MEEAPSVGQSAEPTGSGQLNDATGALLAPADEPVAEIVEPVAEPVSEPFFNEPVLEPVLNEPVLEPVLNEPVLNEPVLNEPVLEPVLNEPVLEPAPIVSDLLPPVLEAVTPPQQITEPVSAPSLEPLSPTPFAQDVQQPLLNGASYRAADSAPVAQETTTQGTKTEGSLRSYPPLFDTSLLLGGQLAALAAAAADAAAALKGFPGGTPTNPLFPLGFPFGAPPTGTTFTSSSGIALSLELLAILALLYTLKRRDGSSVSGREVFRLVSSPRLVSELPG